MRMTVESMNSTRVRSTIRSDLLERVVEGAFQDGRAREVMLAEQFNLSDSGSWTAHLDAGSPGCPGGL
jgi:hypothetical protein